MILDFIVWNVKPQIIEVGSFQVRWYGLLFAAAFYFGYLIISRIFKDENIPEKILDKLTVYMALGVILGARLGHCLFYEPETYLANPIDILKIWEGGLASHGAAVGILLSLYIFSRKNKKSYLWILDRIVIVVALSGFFIRTGNLMNSEIYGIATNAPWGFIFAHNGETIPKHPTQIYEALGYLVIFIALYQLFFRYKAAKHEGLLFGLFLISVFGFRFFVEFIKENQVSFESGMQLNMGQWLSIPLVLFGIGMLLWINHKRQKA